MPRFEFKLVTQPDGDTCTSACLAMLTNQPIEVVIDEYNEAHYNNETTPLAYLDKYGPMAVKAKNDGYSCSSNRLKPGGVYLLIVPSLNLEGYLHHIIVTWFRHEGLRVYDPAQGLEGAKYYTVPKVETNEPRAVPLCTWVIDLIVDSSPWIHEAPS